LLPEYESGWKVVDIMSINSTGVKTHRDHFVTSFDIDSLRKKIEEFRDLNIPDNEICDKYDIKSTRDWEINKSRKSLSNNVQWEDYFIKCFAHVGK
jgi:hypothetical protein